MDSTQSNLYVYVSIAGENKISIFKMSSDTAALTPQGEVSVYSPLAYSPSIRRGMSSTLQFEPPEILLVSGLTEARVNLN